MTADLRRGSPCCAGAVTVFCGVLGLVVGCGSSGGAEPQGTGATDGAGPPGDPGKIPVQTDGTLGESHEGQYHLGPVDFAETEWHNACAPGSGYPQELHSTVGLGGEFLAGVSSEFSQSGGICDACLLIETALGHSIVARIVTYGTEQQPGDIDVSPQVYDAIGEGEYPRTMSWTLARCPDAGNLLYEFQTESNPWWTSLWVRNPRVPLIRVEVRKEGSDNFTELTRATDGTLTDPSGFGDGPFTLRLTALDGQVIEDDLPGFDPGQLVDSGLQFE